MNSQQIIGWMITGCVLFVILMVFSRPLKLAGRLCLNGILGISSLLIGNYILSSTGLVVGINIYTAAFTAIMGIPGVLCLYFLKFMA